MKNDEKEFETELRADYPALDLRGLAKEGTAYPELSYNRLQTQVPIDQPDSNLFSAVFFRDTTIGSLLTRPEATAFDPDKNTNLDYLQFVPKRHMAQFDAYALVTNAQEGFEVMRSVDEENERTRMIEQNPWKSFFYNFGAQPLDPVNLFPGSVLFKNVTRMSAVAKSALQAGAAGVISSAAQEAIIQGNQLTRSIEESLMNPIVSGIFSTVVGGVAPYIGPKVAGMSKKAKERAKREILGVLTDNEEKLTPYSPHGSAGSMGHISGNTLANMPKIVQKGMKTSLMNEMMSGEFQAPKDVAAELFQNNYTLTKNEAGIPTTNVETAMKLDISKTVPVFIEYQNIFFEQAGVKKGFLAETRANRAAKNDPTGQILNYEKFESDVAYTIFSGEKHANEGVNKAAKLLNDQIFEPFKDAAIELGLLPKDVSPQNAFAYFSVHWNQQKIKENQSGFYNMTRDYFMKINDVVAGIHRNPDYKAINVEMKDIKAKIKTAKEAKLRAEVKELNKKLEALEKKSKGTAQKIASRTLKSDEIGGIFHSDPKKKGKLRKVAEQDVLDLGARQTLDRIIGNDNSRLKSPLLNQLNKKSAPLNDRSFLIPQRVAWEWQNQNASDVARSYVHAMAPVLRMNEFAKSLGYTDAGHWHTGSIDKLRQEMHKKTTPQTLEQQQAHIDTLKAEAQNPKYNPEQLARIESQIAAAEKEIKKTKSPEKQAKAADKLDKEFKKQSQNITNAFEVLLGIYGDGPNIHDNSAAKYYKAFLNWNYVRLLGFMTLSAIPDVGLHVLTHGPFASVYHGLRPVLKEAFGLMKNMSKDDIKAIGYGNNTTMGTRLKSLSGHEGLSTQPTFFGRTADKMVQSYGNVTLMNQWNDVQQVWAGTNSINRTLKAIEAYQHGVIDKAEVTRLARLGIGIEDYQIIYDFYKAKGGEDGGTYFANWTQWEIKTKEEAKALAAFQRAVATEIDSVVIVPGLGDKPLIAQTNFGKLLLQFKSFAFAATNKVLFAGIQRRHDANTYFGMVSMLAMGGLSYVVSQVLRGNDDIDLSFSKLAHESIDRSGLIGIVSEVYNMAEKAGLGFGTQASRYQSRSLWGALLGPSTGAFDEMFALVNSIRKADEEHPLTTKDFEKLLRLAPYQNLFYTYYLSRKVSGSLAPKLGFEETQDNRLKSMFK